MHIYPLNPTIEETQLLKHEARLSTDVNDEDNVIPLCEICHGKFDKPRTVEEYRSLFKLKQELTHLLDKIQVRCKNRQTKITICSNGNKSC